MHLPERSAQQRQTRGLCILTLAGLLGLASACVSDAGGALDAGVDHPVAQDAGVIADAAHTSDAASQDSTTPIDSALASDSSVTPDGATMADAAAPDTLVYDTAAPDTAVPDTATPDTAAPPDAWPGPPPGADTDGDGLDDAWEFAAGDPLQLDWQLADTDDDGEQDGLEDPDADGLDNLAEYAAARMQAHRPTRRPHPLRRDLLVELDAMSGRVLEDQVLDAAAEVYAALPLTNADGSEGVQLLLYRDEESLDVVSFSGSFSQRHDLLAGHGPALDDSGDPPLPLDRMVHVVVAVERTDLPTRGGELVADTGDDINKSGIFIYYDAIDALHPSCERPVDPVLPDITTAEALATTLAHELGHALQLGHDTEAGGGINYYNIMSVPAGCLPAQMRTHGDGNSDPTLGSTMEVFAPRFSHAASALMDFERLISVDTATFDQSDGYEM